MSVIKDRNKQMIVFSKRSISVSKAINARSGDMTRKYHQDGERYRIKERKARWKIDPKQVNIQKRAEENQSGYN